MREEREEAQVGLSKPSDDKQKRELPSSTREPFFMSSTLGQRHSLNKSSPYYAIFRIYTCIYVHHLFMNMFRFLSPSLCYAKREEIGTFCELSKYKWLPLLVAAGDLVLVR